mmetsp:Transcript_42812/g.64428  ORF Transcript_42812/g.64428 Transcript_42812/m.64428 type:complete len:1141 (+) Transcript_42812:262-3684(+)
MMAQTMRREGTTAPNGAAANDGGAEANNADTSGFNLAIEVNTDDDSVSTVTFDYNAFLMHQAMHEANYTMDQIYGTGAARRKPTPAMYVGNENNVQPVNAAQPNPSKKTVKIGQQSGQSTPRTRNDENLKIDDASKDTSVDVEFDFTKNEPAVLAKSSSLLSMSKNASVLRNGEKITIEGNDTASKVKTPKNEKDDNSSPSTHDSSKGSKDKYSKATKDKDIKGKKSKDKEKDSKDKKSKDKGKDSKGKKSSKNDAPSSRYPRKSSPRSRGRKHLETDDTSETEEERSLKKSVKSRKSPSRMRRKNTPETDDSSVSSEDAPSSRISGKSRKSSSRSRSRQKSRRSTRQLIETDEYTIISESDEDMQVSKKSGKSRKSQSSPRSRSRQKSRRSATPVQTDEYTSGSDDAPVVKKSAKSRKAASRSRGGRKTRSSSPPSSKKDGKSSRRKPDEKKGTVRKSSSRSRTRHNSRSSTPILLETSDDNSLLESEEEIEDVKLTRSASTRSASKKPGTPRKSPSSPRSKDRRKGRSSSPIPLHSETDQNSDENKRGKHNASGSKASSKSNSARNKDVSQKPSSPRSRSRNKARSSSPKNRPSSPKNNDDEHSLLFDVDEGMRVDSANRYTSAPISLSSMSQSMRDIPAQFPPAQDTREHAEHNLSPTSKSAVDYRSQNSWSLVTDEAPDEGVEITAEDTMFSGSFSTGAEAQDGKQMRSSSPTGETDTAFLNLAIEVKEAGSQEPASRKSSSSRHAQGRVSKPDTPNIGKSSSSRNTPLATKGKISHHETQLAKKAVSSKGASKLVSRLASSKFSRPPHSPGNAASSKNKAAAGKSKAQRPSPSPGVKSSSSGLLGAFKKKSPTNNEPPASKNRFKANQSKKGTPVVSESVKSRPSHGDTLQGSKSPRLKGNEPSLIPKEHHAIGRLRSNQRSSSQDPAHRFNKQAPPSPSDIPKSENSSRKPKRNLFRKTPASQGPEEQLKRLASTSSEKMRSPIYRGLPVVSRSSSFRPDDPSQKIKGQRPVSASHSKRHALTPEIFVAEGKTSFSSFEQMKHNSPAMQGSTHSGNAFGQELVSPEKQSMPEPNATEAATRGKRHQARTRDESETESTLKPSDSRYSSKPSFEKRITSSSSTSTDGRHAKQRKY